MIALCWSTMRAGEDPSTVPTPAQTPEAVTSENASTDLDALAIPLDQSTDVAELSPVSRATKGVTGSKHDFSALTGKVSDACSACHVPHLQAVQPAKRDGNQAILELFRIGNQRPVFQPAQNAPGASSLICLSCHNGTVATSTIGTAHAMIAAHRDGFTLGEFAIRDHPIGLPYPASARDYHPIARVRNLGIRLPDDRVECISCHDPHNALGLPKMLSMRNQRSALCLACHDK